MAPKRSCKGKKRSKKCSRRKSSCPKKPSLFMDDIRWMQFKKAAQEAAQGSISLAREEYAIKSKALNKAWEVFYTSVNPLFITPKFLKDASIELDIALVPIFTRYSQDPESYTSIRPYNTTLIIEALEQLIKSPIKIK